MTAAAGDDPGFPTVAASTPPEQGTVQGERAAALVSGTRSLQSRASSLLAASLMIALGLSALTWYYAQAFTRRTHARQNAQASVASRAQAEMVLPAFAALSPGTRAPEVPAEPIAPPPELTLTEAPRAGAPPGTGAGPAAVPPKSAGELALERRLLGVVFTREAASAGSPATAATGAAAPAPPPALPEPLAWARERTGEGAPALAGLLSTTVAAAMQAQRLPDTRLLLPKGAFIDCTLETAIDSTLPGMTTCITPADTFSADGKVVLLERGTKLIGETRGAVRQGQARLFVLWSEARTPSGVRVPLDSPGTDALGRSGLTGAIERHFWERFGAAILVSVVEGAVQAGVQAASGSNGAMIYAPSGSQDVLTEALKDSAHIAPTISVKNGARIGVLVARDVDFRAVYELRAAVR